MTKELLTVTPVDALEHFGINFDVVKSPVFAATKNGTKPVPNVNAMVMSHNDEVIHGVAVSDSYEIVQTRAYADIISRVTGELNAKFVTGGLLRGGRMTYLQCKLPDTIRVLSTDDTIEKYLTFINSFDGSSKFMILPTGLRVFCANQMVALTKESKANGLRFSHTKSVRERLKQADQAILDAMNAYQTFGEKINWLAGTAFSDRQMATATRQLFSVADDVPEEDISTRTKNNMQKVEELFTQGIGLQGFRGTAWAALNAMTEFSDHHRTIRKSTDAFENRLIGTGAAFKGRAVNVIENVIAMG